MNLLPSLTTTGFSPSSAFVEFVHTYQGPRETEVPGLAPRLPLESPDGQAALANVVQHAAPQLLELAEAIRGIVATNAGAVLVKGLGFERTAAVNGDAVRDALVLALTSAIGEPTDHCADKRVMWPVHSRPVAAGHQATFSESLGEAPLHTDSAFSRHPERYNALYVVRQSRCGGGQTVVVNGPRFLRDFAKTSQGADCIRFLQDSDYAFRVPDAFFAGQRFITGKILAEEPVIRFRHDCIERGFDLRPDLATKEHRFNYSLFRNAAEAHASRTEFLMADGELIVFDNTRLLHGRTDFQDPVRHLIRVRMHERKLAEALRLAS
ncbi:MAG TPA: TauD/TfdA family dioxygenase [Acetobacteraceae bacterium]|nr:TauD/TfdA family dioxygenase [Acetobacteraceae bacterium]